jgi:hypothetical protein
VTALFGGELVYLENETLIRAAVRGPIASLIFVAPFL